VKRCVVLVAVLVAGCEKRELPTSVGSGAGSNVCEQVPFETTTPVAEASGAAWLDIHGKPALVINSDSGNDGDYVIISAETGTVIEKGKLPLGTRGDDVEGFAARGGLLYGLTSSGWMRVWKRTGSGFELTDGPYAIAAVDEKLACVVDDSNCGKNYEGLALAPSPTGPCAGFACSKDDGHLYCLTEKDGKLALDPTRSITADKRSGVLADCAFSPKGTLYAANNMFGNSTVYRIDGWADPATAKVVPIGDLGLGFPEAIAASDGLIYRLSDTGGSPSMMVKFRCSAAGR
jgi:outer membrane protein assembly factor BamB